VGLGCPGHPGDCDALTRQELSRDGYRPTAKSRGETMRVTSSATVAVTAVTAAAHAHASHVDMRRRRRTGHRRGRGGRSDARRGTAGEPDGGDGGRRNRGSVTHATKLSRPPCTGPWRRGRHRPADGVSACVVPALPRSHPLAGSSPGLLAGLGAGCPATAARVTPAVSGSGSAAVGSAARRSSVTLQPGAGLCDD